MTNSGHIETRNVQQEIREVAALIFIVGTLLTGMLFAMALTVVEGITATTASDGLRGSDFGDLMTYIIPLLLISILIDVVISLVIFMRLRANILNK